MSNEKILDKGGLKKVADRIKAAEAKSAALVGKSDIRNANLIEITWADLKALRDSSLLVPGQQYRITDYQCAYGIANVYAVSNKFDIIVTADDVHKLNENARAMHHAGDTYFADCRLEAWQLWYCIDNDDTRFYGVNRTSSKGFIYHMIDEFGNDCPYDFKNTRFTVSGKFTGAYTFSYTEAGSIKDASILGKTKTCYLNVIKPFFNGNGQLQLNFNVFYTSNTNFNCYCNTIEENCYNNYFGNFCHNNTLGKNCYSNSFGNNCSFNTLGERCSSITIESNCSNNTIGKRCAVINLSSSCDHNIFGNDCSSCTLGSDSYRNNIGAGCSVIISATEATENVLGTLCNGITFSTCCSNNTFEAGCNTIEVGSDSYNNHFGEGCDTIYLGGSVEYCSFGPGCDSITLYASSKTDDYYVRWCIFDNGVTNVKLLCSDTSASSSNYIQNVHVHSGVKGTSGVKTITVPDRNLAYSIDYYALNSTTQYV